MNEIEDYGFILAQMKTNYYYGPEVEIVLPMRYKEGFTQFKLLDEGEKYSPVPYVVAVYKHTYTVVDEFYYDFDGVRIKNND